MMWGQGGSRQQGLGYQLLRLTLQAGFHGQKEPRIRAQANLVDWSPTLCLSGDGDRSRLTKSPPPNGKGLSVLIASGLADRSLQAAGEGRVWQPSNEK